MLLQVPTTYARSALPPTVSKHGGGNQAAAPATNSVPPNQLGQQATQRQGNSGRGQAAASRYQLSHAARLRSGDYPRPVLVLRENSSDVALLSPNGENFCTPNSAPLSAGWSSCLPSCRLIPSIDIHTSFCATEPQRPLLLHGLQYTYVQPCARNLDVLTGYGPGTNPCPVSLLGTWP